MNRFLLVAGLVLGVGGAANAQTPRAYFGDVPFERPVSCDPAAPATPFATRPRPLLTDYMGGWYLRVLSAAEEPSLYQRSLRPGPAVYRFTWLRSFDAPMTVRIETTPSGDMRLIAKRLSGRGGYGLGAAAETVDRSLSRAERAKVVALLAKPRPQNAHECPPSTDGADWIFETAESGYALVSRHSPKTGPLREIGETFLGLTGWDLEPLY